MIDMHLHKAQMYALRCAKLQMSFHWVQQDLRYLKDSPQSRHYHALSSLTSSVTSTFENFVSAHAHNTLVHGTCGVCSTKT